MATASEKKTENAVKVTANTDFLKLTLEPTTPSGRVLIKSISTNYFRVNFMEQIKRKDTIFADWHIVSSKMLEVVKTPVGFEIVDRTIRK